MRARGYVHAYLMRSCNVPCDLRYRERETEHSRRLLPRPPPLPLLLAALPPEPPSLKPASSLVARLHGQGAMNDISHDVPARPVHNHVLWTSSAPNAPHQCGHVDMWKPFGRTRIEEKHPPNHLHDLRSVWSPERAREVSASSTGKAPVPQAKKRILR